MTEEAQQMYTEMANDGYRILQEWKEKGQVNYGDAFLELGAKGQFSDIWRKIKKLKRSVWEGQPLVGEQAEQIAAELIPHCLMLIYCLQNRDRQVSEERRSRTIGVAQEDIQAGDTLDIDFSTGKICKIKSGPVAADARRLVETQVPIERIDFDDCVHEHDVRILRAHLQAGHIRVWVRS